MSGGRFAGLSVALLLAVGACGGRTEGGSMDGEGGASSGAGGASFGGRFPGFGGVQQGGSPAKGGRQGSGGRTGQGGQGSGGISIIPSGGRVSFGGAPSGGAPTAGSGGGTACPPCKAFSQSSCSYEVCDGTKGKCVPVSREGQTCDDGNFCTLNELCRAGVCQGGVKNTCGATESECLKITCNPMGFCSKSTADGAVCKTGSGDLCEVGGRCSGGTCQPTYRDCTASVPMDPCWAGRCNKSTGQCEAIPLSGNACTPSDLCSAGGVCLSGKCISQAVDCSGLDTQCTWGECQPGTGKCISRNQPDGTVCASNDACVRGTACTGGVCTGGVRTTACTSGDGCCPTGCTGKTDSDCVSTYIINALNRGWWNSVGDHTADNDNTFTGKLGNSSYNSYFTFDLVGLTSEVSAVRLRLELESFLGPDMFEQVSVWDVSTDPTTLEEDPSGRNTAIFQDLQSGLSYAVLNVYPSNVSTTLVISLGAAAVANVNAARGGYFSVGIHVDTANGTPSSTGEGVRFSEANEFRVHQLELDKL